MAGLNLIGWRLLNAQAYLPWRCPNDIIVLLTVYVCNSIYGFSLGTGSAEDDCSVQVKDEIVEALGKSAVWIALAFNGDNRSVNIYHDAEIALRWHHIGCPRHSLILWISLKQKQGKLSEAAGLSSAGSAANGDDSFFLMEELCERER